MPVVAVVVFFLAVVVLVLLWRWIDGLALADLGQKDKVTAQLDAVKIAASIVVAGGGLFAPSAPAAARAAPAPAGPAASAPPTRSRRARPPRPPR
ncbi:hypothetical protein [Amycolatopsis magusensis]|uniref:hypothetical protein n=1 Tax=Amycolatopsis magusensis TaxID=882444 RepID=UPI0024A85803|nr:hypothetical protein [Amycolatopsis magusensis]MDI5975467.1 hypothetical protein [Amycolatopsis magusensis]